MRILIFDDQADEIQRLATILGEVFPGASIWPTAERPTIFTNWKDVKQEIARRTGKEETIAFFDLALTHSQAKATRADAIAGFERFRSVRLTRPDWVVLLYTRYLDEPRWREAGVDGLLLKQDLDAKMRLPSRLTLVKGAVDAARAGRGLRPISGAVTFEYVDSPSLRQAGAALGEDGLSEIVEQEAKGWRSIQLTALSGGHSGAFVLLVKGKRARAEERRVIKASRERGQLVEEVEAPETYSGRLGGFSGRLVFRGSEIKELGNGRGYYFSLAVAQGRCLIEISDEGERRNAVDAVVAFALAECRRSVREHQMSRLRYGVMLPLTNMDVSRVRSSVPFLVKLGNAVSRRGLWPRIGLSPSEAARHALKVAEGWQHFAFAGASGAACVQHGDMNLRNVFIEEGWHVSFIDPARLRDWPLGYDLARLGIQLRVQWWDGREGRDYFPEEFAKWCVSAGGVARQAGVANVGGGCSEADACDDAMALLCRELSGEKGREVWRGYNIARMWDLLKVISYSDISPFKRLWAMTAVAMLFREVTKGSVTERHRRGRRAGRA
jgi:hypothetical protein